ncbi:hypothetical protein Tco_0068463, partial [Tanacetum coccineum]
GPCVKTGVHGVHVQKCVWFEVELQGAQKNHEDEVHHGANIGAVIMKTRVHGQEGAESNAFERYRGDINMATLGVAALMLEYAHESLTFRDAVVCEAVTTITYIIGSMWKRISDKRTKNQAKNDKTEHGMEERDKVKVQKVKAKSKSTPQSQRSMPKP